MRSRSSSSKHKLSKKILLNKISTTPRSRYKENRFISVNHKTEKKFILGPPNLFQYRNLYQTGLDLLWSKTESLDNSVNQIPSENAFTDHDTNAIELNVLERKVKELESKNELLRERCKQYRNEKIKITRLNRQHAVRWRYKKKELIDLNNKLMKMMEKIKMKMTYMKQKYE